MAPVGMNGIGWCSPPPSPSPSLSLSPAPMPGPERRPLGPPTAESNTSNTSCLPRTDGGKRATDRLLTSAFSLEKYVFRWKCFFPG